MYASASRQWLLKRWNVTAATGVAPALKSNHTFVVFILFADSLRCCSYVEDNITARLYRQAPLNSIWEGSGNVQCIDVLRAMSTHKDSLPAFFRRVNRARGCSAQFDAFAAQVEERAVQAARRVASGEDESRRARALADDMAVCLQATSTCFPPVHYCTYLKPLLQGSLLLTHGHPEVANAFLSSRVCRATYGVNWGTLDSRRVQLNYFNVQSL
jgi:putative acyl-CoA dehydrogenase